MWNSQHPTVPHNNMSGSNEKAEKGEGLFAFISCLKSAAHVGNCIWAFWFMLVQKTDWIVPQ